jgi:hypothetical protein
LEKKNPWFKFYPTDWRADQALRLCSLAARGLWVECMALMHEAKPYGHLLVNGRPVTDSQLASLTGAPVDQITALLGELENAGVSSKRSDGVIYSRRMTRDAKRSAEGKRYGKQGGNPALTHNQTLNPPDNREPSPRSQKPHPDIPKDSKSIVLASAQTLRNQKEKSKQEIKAIWQSNICKEAYATMPADQYATFVEAWLSGDPAANRVAEELNKKMRARKAQGQQASA